MNFLLGDFLLGEFSMKIEVFGGSNFQGRYLHWRNPPGFLYEIIVIFFYFIFADSI